MCRRKRTINIIAVLMSALSCLAQAEEPVYFADENLKVCVESHLGITDPTPADMLALDRLDARRQRIIDLGGLEYATNLIHLWLDNNQIIDISAVAGLTNLTELWVNSNHVYDISPLSGLSKLTRLYLSNNLISDISPLSKLTDLRELWLNSNYITDVSRLNQLAHLIRLELQGNYLSPEAYSEDLPLIRMNNPTAEIVHDQIPTTAR